jgi:hypothetical protein
MKTKFTILLTLLFIIVSANVLYCQEAGEVVFCNSIDEEFNPIGINTEFETNMISVLFRTHQNSKFNVLETILSIFKKDNSGAEILLYRDTSPVNPEWNALYIKDVPLPEVGTFVFLLTTTDAKIISRGEVTIKEKVVEQEIPETIEVEGGTIEALFKEYMQKTTTTTPTPTTE